ncbi:MULTISPECIES: signal peptide peptidase SppA [unclassified Treponema]|uniref:signal peptide peptidase SppA n=1 Tax=unclassified Treponema TaxID=2638727 RepID=UPI0020A2C3B8|nr:MULTISPECIES: signal peptide peptidase SppA [unclassified Treponema]UTC66716.1 signal peptide peptidase SppA [Treponema sp. OMZ 789]UTC69448.1 signal peptide peptidase SppA [Treponema sp. OMZ 790]UTC72162.1 signal peptide peptidase SppA [Treponema sp. OMZ 791]
MQENQEQRKGPSFFRALFRGINILRLIIINIIFFFFFFSFLGVMGTIPSNAKTITRVPSEAVLCINPSGILTEKEADIFSAGIPGIGKKSVILVSDLVKAIKNAAFDRRITSLYLDFSELAGLSSGHLSELGKALETFKNSGKKIYAYAVTYSIPSYFLASYADRIGIDPLGEISFAGFASRPVFFKGLEEKFGIKWNVIQAGAYKGMAETYSRDALSQNVRTNLKSMFDNLWDKYTSDIASNRNISPEKIKTFAEKNNSIIKKYNGNGAKAALEEGFITDIASVDEFAANIGFADSKTFSVNVNTIDYNSYNANFMELPSQNSIGIIHVNGAITSVSTGPIDEAAVSYKIVDLFDMAQDDPTVKAIVLRVNSGGGEVFASEEIRRAVERAKASGKPVVVSMGSVAASGAYWISSSADYIFASPYTITGSIGVLATAPSFKDAVKKHLGITSDLVYSGQKPSYSLLEDPSPEEKEVRQLEVMHIYKTFIETVARGRSLPENTVAELAGGRVYSGEQALNLKLVDALGSLDEAVKHAAELANIKEKYSVKEIKKPLPFTEAVMKGILEDLNASTLSQMNFADIKAFTEFLNLKSKKGIYVYSPEYLIWEN